MLVKSGYQSSIIKMENLFFVPQLLDIELTTAEIHIWLASLDQPVSQFQSLLSMDERIRAERFHFDEHRKRFIIRRGILRTILGCYLSVEPSRLQFCYGRNGKPALADPFGKGKVSFNLSHSEGIALYAFIRNCEIGLDVEHIREISEMGQIAERFFSARENAAFQALPKSKKKEAFFNCWTRKEAFIKATGDGLTWPLDKFDVSLVPGEPAGLLRIEGDSKAASRWSIVELKPSSNNIAAVAYEGHDFQLTCFNWQASTLFETNLDTIS